MLPLYLARIEDLGCGDLLRVDCVACHHVALLVLDFLPRFGLSPETNVLDLATRVRCRGCERGGETSFRSSGGASSDDRVVSGTSERATGRLCEYAYGT
jgi:hypothetical protein